MPWSYPYGVDDRCTERPRLSERPLLLLRLLELLQLAWSCGSSTSSQAFGLAAFGSRTDRDVLYACALDTPGLLVQHVVHRSVLLEGQRAFDLDENGMFVLKLDGSDGETPQLHETLQAALDLGAVLFDQPTIGHDAALVTRDNNFLSMYSRHGRSL